MQEELKRAQQEVREVAGMALELREAMFRMEESHEAQTKAMMEMMAKLTAQVSQMASQMQRTHRSHTSELGPEVSTSREPSSELSSSHTHESHS